MSQSKSSIEERYAAVMELKEGASLSTVGKKYSMGSRTLKALLNRYEKQGISGLQTIQYVHYSDAFILSVMSEYETKQLSLNCSSKNRTDNVQTSKVKPSKLWGSHQNGCTVHDYSGINVPLVAVCNVPPVARCNVPPQKWLQ